MSIKKDKSRTSDNQINLVTAIINLIVAVINIIAIIKIE